MSMRVLPLCTLATVTLLSLGLSGCAETKEAMGLTSQPPDEFAVVDHPPLSMPPDFAALPTPRPGAIERGNNPSEKAAKALFSDGSMELVPQQGVTSLKSQQLTPAEQALVTQSGSTAASPTIRSTLDKEYEPAASPKLIEQLLFWKKPTEPGTIVDPKAEAARIEQAKKSGQPITTGATTAYDRGRETNVQ